MCVGRRRKLSRHIQNWKINAEDHGKKAITDYTFLCWDDIVRQQWIKGRFNLWPAYMKIWKTYFLTSDAGVNLFTVAPKRVLILAFYLLMLPILLTAGFLLSFYIFIKCIWPCISLAFLLCMSLASSLLTMDWILQKVNYFWILRIVRFFVYMSENNGTDLEKRCTIFKQEVLTSLRQSYDEVIVVGHSVGCIVAALSMPENKELAQNAHKLSLLTLGECFPPSSVLPGAHKLRKKLYHMGKRDFYWVDFTSAIDGICFYLTDMVSMNRPQEESDLLHPPILLSTKFFSLFSKESYTKLRYNWFKVHFSYLQSMEKEGEYDFFAITAGAKPLRNRIQKKI